MFFSATASSCFQHGHRNMTILKRDVLWCSTGVDLEGLRGEALKRLKGDAEAELPKKKKVCMHRRQGCDWLTRPRSVAGGFASALNHLVL